MHLLNLSITVKDVATGSGIEPGTGSGLLPAINKGYFDGRRTVTGVDNWHLAKGEGQRIGR